MTAAYTAKHDIACELLARAIELYLRGDSYFSAIHLAGAAEEVLSVMVRELPTPTGGRGKAIFDQIKDLVVAISAPATAKEAAQTEKWIHDRMTEAKNSIKHMRGLNDVGATFNVTEEATDIIDRAISTYMQLATQVRLPHIPGIADFDAHRRRQVGW